LWQRDGCVRVGSGFVIKRALGESKDRKDPALKKKTARRAEGNLQ